MIESFSINRLTASRRRLRGAQHRRLRLAVKRRTQINRSHASMWRCPTSGHSFVSGESLVAFALSCSVNEAGNRHSRAVPSAFAERTRRRSGVKTALHTADVWVSIRKACRACSTFQTSSVPSLQHVRAKRPLGENSTPFGYSCLTLKMRICLPVLTSQRRSVPSLLHERT